MYTLIDFIKNHLGQMASDDDNFKERFEDKAKSLEECEQYIYEQAKEQAKGGNCAGIADNDVLNWAIHYYQEKDVKPKGNVTAKAVSTSPSMAPATPPKAKAAAIQPKPRKAKAKKSEPKAVELSLFGDF